jgi:predicted aspartyl protease
MRRLNVGLPGSNVTRDRVISTIKEAKMGRIVASVIIENLTDQDARIRCDALVDTGASYMVLPDAWRDRLGELDEITTVPLETARQETVEGKICGPVRIQIEGFRPIYNEVLLIDMKNENGKYEPLIGYVILEQSQAAVDMLGHRLIPVKRMDLK